MQAKLFFNGYKIFEIADPLAHDLLKNRAFVRAVRDCAAPDMAKDDESLFALSALCDIVDGKIEIFRWEITHE